MKIAIPQERRQGETRVAASPDTVKKLVAQGCNVVVETGAGLGAAFTDEAYREAGASITPDYSSAVGAADVVLKVRRPLLAGEGTVDELARLVRGAVLVGILDPHDAPESIAAYAKAGISAFAMELMPRITRAQSMDVLSSQSNLAGYKAVLDATAEFGRAFPMMMTAAGTVPPARVLVMGAGVAGLQAIATARRLGAIVSATDVRPAAKEQVESLGGSFVAVEDEEFRQAETAAGYAKPMSEAYQKKQAALIAETIKKQDIVICTALIPGRKAPVLVSEAMVRSMKPGSVIVDLAVERGGNCPLSEAGKVVEVGGVRIVGHTNVPGRIAVDASALYAKNLLNFLNPLIDKDSGKLAIDWDDEIITGTALTRDGSVVHPAFAGAAKPAKPQEPVTATVEPAKIEMAPGAAPSEPAAKPRQPAPAKPAAPKPRATAAKRKPAARKPAARKASAPKPPTPESDD
ncbi:MAG: Re/Si-specific NAD(P)(+) transhydrogenase subunit alpha [Inquilinus sp.]|nr:Re/Si-specific NAD(P)(+) transhydrogenase subunit alpha [Inquilinus sp.]